MALFSETPAVSSTLLPSEGWNTVPQGEYFDFQPKPQQQHFVALLWQKEKHNEKVEVPSALAFPSTGQAGKV